MESRTRAHGRGGMALGIALVVMSAGRPATATAESERIFEPVSAEGDVLRSSVAPADGGWAVVSSEAAPVAYRPGRVIVKFRGAGSRPLLAGSGSARRFRGDPDLSMVENPAGLSVSEAVSQYRSRQDVAWAEPDYVLTALEILPSDPLWSQQWDMAKIAAPAAWASQTDASDVVVGVLDTGIDFTHPDLGPNLWSNPADGTHGFTARNGVLAAGGLDDNGHGTHVAGTIGAATNNGVGMAGINWNVRLLALKFLDANGSGSTSDAVLLLDEAVALRQQGVNIRVINSSWGGPAASQALKDAFARAQDAGILLVCAAGNSGQNADLTPMYPAAYDLRGIVSVLATDSSDYGASFSNYGRASTDLSAPGVSTLSTVPAGTCALCATSGYRTLSGTSMASPHVAGVAAALFHRNPALTAIEARDVLLDPASTDRLTEAKAIQSTTSGRLHFAKAVANPLLSSPRLNGFPAVSAPAALTAASGQTVTLSASASDPDGDPLTTTWAKVRYSTNAWLVGKMVDTIFTAAASNPGSFVAPAIALPVTASYVAATADGRGGSAVAPTDVTVAAAPAPGGVPSGTLTASPASGPAGTVVTFSFPATDPEGGTVFWDLLVNSKASSSASCCFSGTSTTLTFPYAGVYRVRAQAIDRQLNLSASSSTLVTIGGATGVPPVASGTLDVVSGPVPLTVHFDLRGSYDPDGSVVKYEVDCDATGSASETTVPTGSCTITTPGPHLVRLFAVDNSGYWDSAYLYAMATAGGTTTTPPADTAAPTVAVSSPSAGATVTGTVTVTASATDDVGVARVELYLDGTTLIGSKTAAPWAVSWDTTKTAAGTHALSAKAFDAAGNSATSAPVSVNVAAPAPPDTTAPTAALTSPASGSTIARRSKTTISASASDNVGVARVDFTVDGTIACSSAAAPFSCSWAVGGKAGKTYQLRAIAWDAAGNAGASASVTVMSF